MPVVLKISLIITAIHLCFKEGMVFGEIRIAISNFLERHCMRFADTLGKPVYACLVCMSSFWGVLVCIYYGVPLHEIPETILMVCGLNGIISSFLKVS